MQNATQIKFVSKERSLFFPTLKKRVDRYFAHNNLSKNANAAMVIKTIVLLTGYIAPFVAMLVWHIPYGISLLLWAIMGFSLAGIGMSVMHDANHGAYSSNEKINTLLGHTLTLLGGSTNNWKIQHNLLHHNYTNIAHADEDINEKWMLKLSPHSKSSKAFHSLQHIYAFFLYGLSTLYWVMYKDFPQFNRYIKNGLNKDSKAKNAMVLLLMILHRVVYLFVFLALPVMLGLPFWQVLLGFFVMHFIAGLALTVVFQLAHTVEGTTHPLPNETGVIENDWAIHQMNTTINFATGNPFLSWYVGGLNFQVEHHLFPRVCHVHYPKIAGIVKETAHEFGIPYLENKTFVQALSAHIAALKRFGRVPMVDAIA